MNEWILPLGKRKTTIKETGEMNGTSGFENLMAKIGMCFRVNVQRREMGIVCLGFPGGSEGKESACNAGDPDLIPGSERSPGEENGNALHENFMDRGAWWPTAHPRHLHRIPRL